MRSVQIKEVTTSRDVREFVKLPFNIYKDNAFWVPPIIKDEIQMLSPTINPAFEFCEAKFWLAYRDKKLVGRIGIIINELANEKYGKKMARINRTEFFDDKEAIDKLFEVAELFAKSEQCVGIHGPLGFSNLDHQAVLVEGFDYIPSVASEYHLPYYHTHFERLGYKKEIDWVEFRLTLAEEIPAKAQRISEMVKKRYNLKVQSFKNKDEILPYIDQLFAIFNEAFADLFSTFLFNKKMIDFIVKKYFSLLNPDLVKMVHDANDALVGFIVAVPSLSKAMQKANGRLYPFGIWHILKGIKHPVEADLFLTGVLPSAANQGVGAVLMTELQKEFIKYKIRVVETTGMIETNRVAIQHWTMYDHIQHKRKRCYIKLF